MNLLLGIILFCLMIYIDRERGFRLFLSLIFNFVILMILFYFIALGIHPVICSLIGCFLVSSIILFFVNGNHLKTRASFLSIVLVLIILAFFIIFITKISRIAGFGYESYEEINMFSYDVKIDFTNITISLIIISLIGATVDTSIAISSALYEVYDNNKKLSIKQLFISGMNIGKDILCTTTNTLLFAFLGDFMTLILWYYTSGYHFLEIINAKTFVAEIIKILFSAIGCFMVIPITSYVTSKLIYKEKNSCVD